MEAKVKPDNATVFETKQNLKMKQGHMTVTEYIEKWL
jgi:hypothetical protein